MSRPYNNYYEVWTLQFITREKTSKQFCRILSPRLKVSSLLDMTITAPTQHIATMTTGLLSHHLQVDKALSFQIHSSLRPTLSKRQIHRMHLCDLTMVMINMVDLHRHVLRVRWLLSPQVIQVSLHLHRFHMTPIGDHLLLTDISWRMMAYSRMKMTRVPYLWCPVELDTVILMRKRKLGHWITYTTVAFHSVSHAVSRQRNECSE